ncbi:hypothetical protein ACFL47_03700 [Candidatus Latescibacterota bacterium]
MNFRPLIGNEQPEKRMQQNSYDKTGVEEFPVLVFEAFDIY